MPDKSACLEMMFTDVPDFSARVARARDAGFQAVEFWLWSNKDLDALQAAVLASGLRVTGFVAEPMMSLVDAGNHATFLAALPASIAVAQRLGARFLFIQAGKALPTGRASQTAALIAGLRQAAAVLAGSGVTLLLEPVSDSPGGFLALVAEGIDIVAAVDRPEVRLLADIYHSAMAAERLQDAIGPGIALVGHVHIADHPGRGAPGTGALDIDGAVEWITAQGYKGDFGYEHRMTS